MEWKNGSKKLWTLASGNTAHALVSKSNRLNMAWDVHVIGYDFIDIQIRAETAKAGMEIVNRILG